MKFKKYIEEDNDTNEALQMPKAKWISSRLNHMFNQKFYKKLDDMLLKKKGISQIIGDMKKVSGKPKFGKASKIGSLIGALEKLEDTGLDFITAWDNAEEVYRSATDWEKSFKELNPEWDDK